MRKQYGSSIEAGFPDTHGKDATQLAFTSTSFLQDPCESVIRWDDRVAHPQGTQGIVGRETDYHKVIKDSEELASCKTGASQKQAVQTQAQGVALGKDLPGRWNSVDRPFYPSCAWELTNSFT